MSCATNATWRNMLRFYTVASTVGAAFTVVVIAFTIAGGAFTIVGNACTVGGVACTAGVGAATSHFNDDGEVGW